MASEKRTEKAKDVWSDWWTSGLILVGCSIVTAIITYVLYNYTQDLLLGRLRERLTAIVATGSLQFDPRDLESIRTVEDAENPTFERVVAQLDAIRKVNSNLRFAYLMRRSEDPNIFEFIADAESLISFEEADLNENGTIDPDEELPMPGDPFDVTEFAVMRDEAFANPIAERELYEDQWGSSMSAYAPIYNNDGEAIAILGIDVLVNDFLALTRETLLPFLLFIIFLVLLLTLLTFVLVRIYNERVEFVKELDKQKDELLSIVSHQLATPVSSMKWYLEMLLDGDLGKLNKEQKEHIQGLSAIALNLADLVSMILDVSRIQLSRMQVSRQSLDLDEFFQEIINVIEAKAKEKNIKLITKIPKKLAYANLDKRLMRMTLENLLSNAVKYTPNDGEVILEVKTVNNTLSYSVTDTGCGIPKKDHEKIFGKLFRASNVQSVDGNGFGLYVAKGAVVAHGGTIDFKSIEGKGTTFNVQMPLDEN